MLFGAIWCYLMLFDAIWRYLALFAAIWRYLKLFDAIWRYWALFWSYVNAIWHYLTIFWYHLDVIWYLFEAIWCYLTLFLCNFRTIWRYLALFARNCNKFMTDKRSIILHVTSTSTSTLMSSLSLWGLRRLFLFQASSLHWASGNGGLGTTRASARALVCSGAPVWLSPEALER